MSCSAAFCRGNAFVLVCLEGILPVSYTHLMESYDRDKLDGLLNGAVNFREINQNEAEIIFELLLANFSFEEILRTYREYSNNISVMEEPFLRYTALELQRRTGFLKRYEKKREQLNFVCILLYAVSYGQSCIESLQYMDINEIGILNKDYICLLYTSGSRMPEEDGRLYRWKENLKRLKSVSYTHLTTCR